MKSVRLRSAIFLFLILSAANAFAANRITDDLSIRAVIHTEEAGAIEAVWQQGGSDTTTDGHQVIWGHFYADPSQVNWGSSANPDLFVKIWFDVGGRVDVNFFHVSVPDIDVFADYKGTSLEGTATLSQRYVRLYYNQDGADGREVNIEDGLPAAGYYPSGAPPFNATINSLNIGAVIITVDGPINGVWHQGGSAMTEGGHQVLWGHFYASPTDVNWGSPENPDLFVKIWFDASGRIDVNYFHVSVPDIEVYSDYPSDGVYNSKDTAILQNRYIRHEFQREASSGQTWYKDMDGDGYSDGVTLVAESRPAGYYLASELTAISGDTDDNDPAVNPEINNGGETLQMTYEVPPIQIMPQRLGDDDVQRINFGNMPLAGNLGVPVLPVIPAKIMLPNDFDISHVEVTHGEQVDLTGSYKIEYGQQPYPLLPGVEPKLTEKNMAIYGSDEPYPGKLYDVVSIQKLRGVSILLINLHPVEFRPLSGKITYYKDMTVKVYPGQGQGMQLKAVTQNDVHYRSLTIRNIKFVADNYEVAEDYQQQAFTLSDWDGTGLCNPAESFQYVLITGEAIKNATTSPNINDLIAHRQSLGMSAAIVTIEDIYANYTGVDQAEQLRNFIKDAYNNWETDFVLLGGDTNIIPMRKLWCISWPGSSYEDHIPSDLYYQCLDGSFNSDGDDKWGEPNDGENGNEVDLYAELFVGRASAENAEEMANFIHKTLAYENDNSVYKKRALMCGENLGFGGVSEYAKNLMEEIRSGTSSHGYSTTGFESDATFSVDVLYEKDRPWDKNDIIGQINSGQFGVINHLGHSNYNLVMQMYNGDTGIIDNVLPTFAYSQGCIPGNFEKDCIAERLTTTSRYGMFAVVFNSRYGWGSHDSTDGPSQRYNREFWDAYFSEGQYHFGAMNADSHEDNAWRIDRQCMRWCFYESNLLGDPAGIFAINETKKQPPLADAGPDQIVDVNNSVILNASASSDEDGTIVSYFWEQTQGPAVAINNKNLVQADFTAPDLGTDGGFLTFRLTVTDNDGLKSTDTCRININKCSYNISPVNKYFDSSGGTGNINITATDNCNWSASCNEAWLTITSGNSGSGNGTVSYSVASNTGTESRSGNITVSGKTFTVNQTGLSCTYQISPESKSFTSSGGTGSISVETSEGCGWATTVNYTWIKIISGKNGKGNGTVNYSVSPNSQDSSRSGSITIAGKTFKITQAGVACTYTIEPSSSTFSSSGGTGTIDITTSSSCTWTASSNAAWLTITSSISGSGNGEISYSVSSNSQTAYRSGSISVGGKTFTVNQLGASVHLIWNSGSWDLSNWQ